MSLVWIILIGFVVGAIAKFVMPGAQSIGFWLTAALCVGGSIIATYAGQAVGFYRAGHPAGFIGSLVGAVLLIYLYNKFVKKT
ncbi:MAG: GlsB/YeaQ/YmgE family stress response membrane protein [Burkholderiales bacterium]